MYVYDTPVPFAPVPTAIQPMRFRHDDTWTFEDNPISRMWQDAYRDCAHRVMVDDFPEARRLASLGQDLESAYIHRVSAESRTARCDGSPFEDAPICSGT